MDSSLGQSRPKLELFPPPSGCSPGELEQVVHAEAPSEPEGGDSEHAVHDSALVSFLDSEHALVDHRYGFDCAFRECLVVEGQGPVDPQGQDFILLFMGGLFGVAPLDVAHHEADSG